MFSDVFIRRPILATVSSLVIILAGAICIPLLPIARYPELAPPQVSITAFYTGANAQAVESAVTTPLEQVVNGVEGMTYMQSSSTNSGVSQINVFFDIGRDADLAAVDVQNRVNQVLGRLPADVRTTGVTVQKNTAGFMGGLGFFSKDNRYSSSYISNYLDLYVRDALKRVPGVGNVLIFGERKYAMRLWLDPARLAARGITAGDVVNALREQNLQVAAGALGDAPADDKQAYNLSVRVMGRLTEPSQFENVVVKAGADGALVRVSDVGRAELGAETYSANLRFIGLEASGMGIALLPSANALAVYQGVMKEMARLEKNFPPGLEWRLAFDNVSVVAESIKEVLVTLAEAIFLVILVMFLFLQNWRSTLIPAITIPVSLVGTFAFVKLFGFSINTLTLFGIVLATGIVVDDAIVVIENIERHMREEKKSSYRAAIDAMREVFGAVVVIGLVLVAVFVPVAFFPGTTGRLYQQFSLTIAFAVVLSVFNAVTFTPALAAVLLAKESHTHGRFFTGVNRLIESGTNGYVRLLRRALALRPLMLGLFGLGLVGTWWLFKTVPSAFVPDEDEGYFISIIQAPGGASLGYTTEIAKQAEAILFKDPDIQAAFSVVGFSFSGAAPNNGLIFTRLKEYSERPGKNRSLTAVLNRVRGPMMGIPGALVLPFAPGGIQGLSTFGGFQYQLLDQTGGDISRLAEVAADLSGKANQSGEVVGLYSSFRANDPQLVVEIDRDRARSLNLPLREVTDALQVFLGSAYVNDFDFNNRAYRVYVQADQQYRSDPKALRQFYARAQNGAMVPLDSVVRASETTAPQVISHFNLFRSAEINGVAAPGVSSGQALEAMGRLSRQHLPPGFDFAWSGQSLEEVRAGSQTVYIFALSLILVYLVLAAQYESWVLPFIILLGVPLAVIGGLGAQWLRGLANDVFCQVGLVMLIGLAAKNSILIVEFAEQLREQGLSVLDAAIESSRIRLRPILMTSFAFILGVMPLAVATGAGAGARNSVGTSVAGGMLASTFLSIFFIPVLYVVIRSLAPGTVRRSADDDEAKPVEERRMRSRFLAAFLVTLGCSALPAAAQPAAAMERVTFAEAIERAKLRNPTVGQAAQAILRSQALLQQAKSVFHPLLYGFVGTTVLDDARGFDGNITQPRTQTTINGTASFPFLAASRWAEKNQAADQLGISRISAEDTWRQVAVTAAQSYFAVIVAQRQREIAFRNRDTAKALADYSKARLDAGQGSRLNNVRSSQELATASGLVQAAELLVRAAQEALGVAIFAPGAVDANGDPDLPLPVLPPASDSFLTARPDVRLFSAELSAADRVVNDYWKSWVPEGTAFFTPQYVTPKGFFEPAKTWRAQFQLSIPLYDRSLIVSKNVRIADRDSAKLRLDAVTVQARSELRLAQEAVTRIEQIVNDSRQAAGDANEALRITEIAYRAGATSNIEVVQAQQSARNIEVVAAQAEDRLRQARLDLLVALGQFPTQ